MSFTMLRGVEPLTREVEARMLQERIGALARTPCALSDRARRALLRATEQLAKLK